MSTNATGADERTAHWSSIDVTDATLAEVRAVARDRSVHLERRGGRTRLVVDRE